MRSAFSLHATQGFSMKIEYELKFKDYLFFNAMHQFFSVPTQLFFGGFAGFVFYLYSIEGPWDVSIVSASFTYVALWVAQFLFLLIYLCFGQNRSLFTRYVIEIQDDALYAETPFARSYHLWKGITKVVSRPGYVAVYMNAHAAHILPARAFSSAEQLQQFKSALLGKLGQA
jgi:hypothetical protein